MKWKKLTIVFSLLFIFCGTTVGYAADVHLTWDPSSGEVAGYRIYYGTSPGSHPNMVEVGNVTDYILTGLSEGVTYYLVARAYNTYGESGDSNELQWISGAAPPPPPPPEEFSISNLAPSNFIIGSVHVGETVYIDRTYTILSGYSSRYEGLALIKTACDDKYNSSLNYLSFEVNKASTVYVCFEQTTPPIWLSSGFVKTNDTIDRSHGSLPIRTYDIWSKDYTAGNIVLGGSAAEGAGEINATYFVLVKEQSESIDGPAAPTGIKILGFGVR